MITYEEYIHPADRKSLEKLKSMNGFSNLVKKFLSLGIERYMHQMDLASKIRLSEKQLPEIYNMLPPICEKLSVPVPELYLEASAFPNAYTYGDTHITITVTTSLIDKLSTEEIEAVLAHECGHIACHHVLYHTMGTIFLAFAEELLGLLALPLQGAMLQWMRNSELSCDRAASIVTSPETVKSMLAHLSGGSGKYRDEINMELWAQQAQEYKEISNDGNWNKVIQLLTIRGQDHPFNAVRLNEIMKWEKGPRYQNAVKRLEAAENGEPMPAPWHILHGHINDIDNSNTAESQQGAAQSYQEEVDESTSSLSLIGGIAKGIGKNIGAKAGSLAHNLGNNIDNLVNQPERKTATTPSTPNAVPPQESSVGQAAPPPIPQHYKVEEENETFIETDPDNDTPVSEQNIQTPPPTPPQYR